MHIEPHNGPHSCGTLVTSCLDVLIALCGAFVVIFWITLQDRLHAILSGLRLKFWTKWKWCCHRPDISGGSVRMFDIELLLGPAWGPRCWLETAPRPYCPLMHPLGCINAVPKTNWDCIRRQQCKIRTQQNAEWSGKWTASFCDLQGVGRISWFLHEFQKKEVQGRIPICNTHRVLIQHHPTKGHAAMHSLISNGQTACSWNQ